MHVQLLTRPPSAHPAFQREPMMDARRVSSRSRNHLDRKFTYSGPAGYAYLAYGKVGTLIGFLESFQNLPIEGTVTIEVTGSVTGGASSITGSMELFNPSLKPAVLGALDHARRMAGLLALDGHVKSLHLTYSQELEWIKGNPR